MIRISVAANTTEKAENLNFSQLLRSKWTEIHDNTNAFRYKLGDVCEKLVSEKFLLQLNINRGTKRRVPEKFEDIRQPFDETKFNFNKTSKDEIMFKFTEEGKDDFHYLIVNVSPISRYHSLLCPSMDKSLPQIVTKDSLKLAIDLVLWAQDCDLRIGFNSLCAWASVNHLHYHLFIEKNNLPVESVKCKHIIGPLYIIEGYPAQGFCFEITPSYKIDLIFKLLDYFLTHSISHNVFITRGETMEGVKKDGVFRVIIYPRKSSVGAKQFKGFNVATCELSGWITVYNTEDYESLTVEDLDVELAKWQIDNFEQLCQQIRFLYETS